MRVICLIPVQPGRGTSLERWQGLMSRETLPHSFYEASGTFAWQSFLRVLDRGYGPFAFTQGDKKGPARGLEIFMRACAFSSSRAREAGSSTAVPLQ